MTKYSNDLDRPWGPGHFAYEYNLKLDQKRAHENKITPIKKSLVKFWGPGHPDYDEQWRSYREQWVMGAENWKTTKKHAVAAREEIDKFIESKKPKKKIYNPQVIAVNENNEASNQ